MTTLITTGLPALDTLLGGGLRPGGLTVVAGRSQSGMTTLLDTIACEAAFRDRVPTVLADLETSTRERMLRIGSALSGAPLFDMQRFQLGLEDARRLRDAERASAGAPFWFADDTRDLVGLRESVQRHQARLLLVDGARFLTRVDADAARITGVLADLAAGCGVAVVATHPLAWDPNPAAGIADLTTEVAYTAENLLLLNRPSLDGDRGRADEVDITCVKARNGFPGSVTVFGDFAHARMVALDSEPAVSR